MNAAARPNAKLKNALLIIFLVTFVMPLGLCSGFITTLVKPSRTFTVESGRSVKSIKPDTSTVEARYSPTTIHVSYEMLFVNETDAPVNPRSTIELFIDGKHFDTIIVSEDELAPRRKIQTTGQQSFTTNQITNGKITATVDGVKVF